MSPSWRGLLLSIVMLATPAKAEDQPISFGTARLLLAFAPTLDDPALQRQRDLLDHAQPAMTERDLVLIPVIGPGPNDLRRRYRVTTTGFEAILVGKDGGAKYRAPVPITTDQLIAMIDAMPMRRQEMRSK